MIHTSERTVTFRSPFTLPGLGRDYPPGRYTIQTDDEQLDLSFTASRRVATTIMLVSGGMTQAWPVSPTDLDAALSRDATKSAR